ncbi:MAG: hypothetical protein DRO11_08820 [Methanobacteriota archaeon]|nr:MAG: hypothetical protein DRO11_08820 [Euryarchaeota archaeon]
MVLKKRFYTVASKTLRVLVQVAPLVGSLTLCTYIHVGGDARDVGGYVPRKGTEKAMQLYIRGEVLKSNLERLEEEKRRGAIPEHEYRILRRRYERDIEDCRARIRKLGYTESQLRSYAQPLLEWRSALFGLSFAMLLIIMTIRIVAGESVASKLGVSANMVVYLGIFIVLCLIVSILVLGAVIYSSSITISRKRYVEYGDGVIVAFLGIMFIGAVLFIAYHILPVNILVTWIIVSIVGLTIITNSILHLESMPHSLAIALVATLTQFILLMVAQTGIQLLLGQKPGLDLQALQPLFPW